MTLFPDLCMTVMGESVIGRAVEKGIIDVACHNIRDYTDNKQKQVDDAPFGGGMEPHIHEACALQHHQSSEDLKQDR